MTDPEHGRRRQPRILLAAAAVLAVVGVGTVGVGLAGQQSAPSPAAAAPPPSAASTLAPADAAPTGPSDTGRTAPSDTGALARSIPTAISIPAIGVESSLIELGLNPDNTVQVPQPGPDYDKAAWFNGSPTPGELGPSMIEGHIDSAANGPSVFFELATMQPGDQITVTRQDGSTPTFEVGTVEEFSKDAFPTSVVYGNTDVPALRLITCGGAFNPQTSSYESNIVVFATLVR